MVLQQTPLSLEYLCFWQQTGSDFAFDCNARCVVIKTCL